MFVHDVRCRLRPLTASFRKFIGHLSKLTIDEPCRPKLRNTIRIVASLRVILYPLGVGSSVVKYDVDYTQEPLLIFKLSQSLCEFFELLFILRTRRKEVVVDRCLLSNRVVGVRRAIALDRGEMNRVIPLRGNRSQHVIPSAQWT